MHVCVGVHPCVWVCMHGCASMCVWVCMHVCVGVYACVCGCASMCVGVYASMCVGVYACVWVCVCVFVCVVRFFVIIFDMELSVLHNSETCLFKYLLSDVLVLRTEGKN